MFNLFVSQGIAQLMVLHKTILYMPPKYKLEEHHDNDFYIHSFIRLCS